MGSERSYDPSPGAKSASVSSDLKALYKSVIIIIIKVTFPPSVQALS